MLTRRFSHRFPHGGKKLVELLSAVWRNYSKWCNHFQILALEYIICNLQAWWSVLLKGSTAVLTCVFLFFSFYQLLQISGVWNTLMYCTSATLYEYFLTYLLLSDCAGLSLLSFVFPFLLSRTDRIQCGPLCE